MAGAMAHEALLPPFKTLMTSHEDTVLASRLVEFVQLCL
jgi:hypothetical protein